MTSSYVSISQNFMEDMFEISFTVIQHGISPNTGRPRMTPFEVFQSPFTVPCEELIQDVPAFLRRNVANYLSEIDVGTLASEITSYYQEVIHRTATRTTFHRLIPLIVYLHVDAFDHGLVPSSFHLQTTALYGDNEYMMDIFGGDDHESTGFYHSIDPSSEQSFHDDNQYPLNTSEYLELSEINQVIEQSMQHLHSVPATENAIASLKKMKKSSDEIKASQCSICLENFDEEEDDDDISALPCDHFFHNNCIVGWLNVGHTCPLCRFELSV